MAIRPAQPHTALPRRNGKRRRFNHLKLTAILVFAISLVALVALIFIRGNYVSKPDEEALQEVLDTGTFLDGISIDGIDVSGLTYEAARAQILPSVTEAARTINISVVHDTTLWLLNAVDLGALSTLDNVLNEAMLLGRSGTQAENAAMKQALAVSGHSYTTGFVCDPATLSATVADIAAGIGTPPVEPYAEADAWAGEPTFIYHEGTDGYGLDAAALSESISVCLAAGNYTATLEPELVTTKPQHDLNWIKQNTQLRAQWQTDFGSSSSLRNANRVGNIQKATTILNGAAIAPGEEFNFNAYIGPRTESGGWPLAPGIVNGNSYEMQAGGGICQVSTTLYNALLCAGPEIKITERYHHSWPSSYADTGLDSTVTGTAESGKSLNFINNTGATLYIFAVCDQDNKKMNIYIYGEPLSDGVSYKTRGELLETIEPGEPVYTDNPEWPLGYEEKTIDSRKGYKADAYRDKYVNGEFISGELLYTDSYRAVPAQITRGIGDPTLPVPQKAT